MHAATGATLQQLLLLLKGYFRGQPSGVESSSPLFGTRIPFYFCKYDLTTVLLCSVYHTRVCGVCRVSREGCSQTFFFVGSPRFCAREGFFDVSATTKIPGTKYDLTCSQV